MDYSSRPYAEWVENAIVKLFDVDPDSILICVVKDKVAKSAVWNIGQEERAAIIQDILAIGVLEAIEKNHDKFYDLATEVLWEILENKNGDSYDEEAEEYDDEEEYE